MPIKTLTPTVEQIKELRNLFIQKIKTVSPSDTFHPVDVDRVINADLWCTRFLEMYDLDMEVSFKKLWETCMWRKQYGANNLHESNLCMEYLQDGVVFTHNKDLDGKPLLIFKTKLHTKGSKNMDEVIRVVVYWIERIHRETNMEKITIFFDMSGTGLSNMDLDFVKQIIETFKMYYPNALNYILIYDMAWVLNAAFKIVKGLLPAKALEILKMISKKDINNYIDKDNCLECWGGTDNYEFSFIPEKITEDAFNSDTNNTLSPFHHQDDQHVGIYKKVHFDENAGESFSIKKNSNLAYEDISDKMLRLSPNEFLNFSKGDGSDSNVEITSISKIPVIYKIQTTSPEKFRVRPRSGVLNPSETVSVSIFLKAEHHLSESSKDKFLIMCMPVPQGTDLTAQPMSELWKHKQFNSPEVEQHRLCCVYKSTTEYARNGYSGNEMSDGKGLGKEGTVNDLSRHASQLEKHLKLTQILQGVTIVFLLILSMAMVYMVKLQSQDNATPQANILDMTSCPMGRKH